MLMLKPLSSHIINRSRTMSQRRRQRRRNREARRRQRQRERSRRQRSRQENRTRRAEGRQAVRMERVKQKGASGFYSPQGIKARGDVATTLIGQGIDIAGMVATGGASAGLQGLTGGDMGSLAGLAGAFGGEIDRRDEIIGAMDDSIAGGFDVSSTPIMGFQGFNALNGFDDDSQDGDVVEKKPFYTNPLVIAGGLGALYFLFGRRK